MKQSKKLSIMESFVNQIVGTILVLVAQDVYFRIADIQISTPKHIGMVIMCMIISTGKHYVIRRYFERKK